MSKVAPFAGAWIEMYRNSTSSTPRHVAPFAGAWIEILIKGQYLWTKTSHPSRVRGLKYQQPDIVIFVSRVAPFAGAWIEICVRIPTNTAVRSHPSLVRGLKYIRSSC